MTQLMHDVAEAQDAGNEAYALAEEQGKTFVECADAYRKAYCAERDRQDRQYFSSPAVTLHDAALLADAKAAQFAAHVAGLSDETKADIELTRRVWNDTEAEAY
jgi:hypothetical protein